MKIKSAFLRLLQGRDLTKLESQKIFRSAFARRMAESEIKTLLLLLAKKGENATEVLGCLKALQSFEKPLPAPAPGLLDNCGTGGDGKHSLNISTLAAFVIAGAGGKVAKHGNRSISSRCGSSDLMEALGVNLSASAKKMTQSIQKSGIGYFHAPLYHPIFSKLQPLRRRLKIPTILNLLGPLANPFRISYQLVGVSSAKNLKLYAEVLRGIKDRKALVCHSRDGLDEISSQVITEVAKISRGKILWGKINPQRLGLRRSKKSLPKVHSPRQGQELALKLLRNQWHGPARDTVVLNAAAGLWISGKARSLTEGIQMAEASLSSGKAYGALLQLKKISHSHA